MPLLLCEAFEVDSDGLISCSGDTSTITLEEVQALSAPNRLTWEQTESLIGATLLALVTGFVFAIILRQLR